MKKLACTDSKKIFLKKIHWGRLEAAEVDGSKYHRNQKLKVVYYCIFWNIDEKGKNFLSDLKNDLLTLTILEGSSF